MFGLSDAAVKVIGYLIMATVLLLVLWFGWSKLTGVYYAQGKADADAAYAVRDAQQGVSNAKQLADLITLRDAQDKQYLSKINDIQSKYEKDTASANQTISDLRVRIANGTVRLYDPGSPSTLACGDSTPAGSPAAIVRTDATPGRELSDEAADFLSSEASRADAVVRQLTALQIEEAQLYQRCTAP